MSTTQATRRPTNARGATRMGDNHCHPRSARACHNGRKPKGPALVTPRKRGFSPHHSGALSFPVSSGMGIPISAWFRGWERLSVRTAARLFPCDYPHPHQYGLVSLLVFQVSTRRKP
jgi:hypothetical protein